MDEMSNVEEGELESSNDENCYTPLERPLTSKCENSCKITTGIFQKGNESNSEQPDISKNMVVDDAQMMRSALDTEGDSQLESSDDSSTGSSDGCLKKLSGDTSQRKRRKKVPRTVMLRVESSESEVQKKRARFKKYNIWTATLQEDQLAENMRGCDVEQKRWSDRNVENYDLSLKYSLNGENRLKRRLSNSPDDFSDNELPSTVKRPRASSSISYQRRKRRSSSTSDSDMSRKPRNLPDLDDISNRDPLDVAREMANKLNEEKDSLLERIVEIIGLEIPTEIYKKTQTIEAAGGMMVYSGIRRRTSGGLFLYLLKNDERLSANDKKLIFLNESKNDNKNYKDAKTMARDRKVEELKKRLSEQEKDLPALSSRKDLILLGSDLTIENQGNLSNPPPSPVGQEQSPEYKVEINDVEKSADKPTTSASVRTSLTTAFSPSKELIDYNDDFLDINCGDMDF